MSRIAIPSQDAAPEASRPVLEAVSKQLGVVPNMYRLLSLSPAALQGFAANSGALVRALELRTRERIALAVAQVNGCDYCLSAHAYLAVTFAKLAPAEVALNRRGGSGDAKAAAAVRFAVEVFRQRGQVGDADMQAVRDAGFGDAEIVEIVAVTAENIFTNLLNTVAGTPIDFPVVRAAEAA